MLTKQGRIAPFIATAGLMIFLFDNASAYHGAYEGLQLCIQTVIPSLFPLLVFSAYLTPLSVNLRVPWLCKLYGLPEGWEPLFIIGSIGGYPVGVQCICQCVARGNLRKEDAEHMLGICSCCGPSFLFGVVGSSLASPLAAIAIMVIGISGALINNILSNHEITGIGHLSQGSSPSFPAAMNQGIRSMGSICAWAIMGRIAVVFLEKRIGTLLPHPISVLLGGIVELTNGCVHLHFIPSDTYRFLAAAFLTAFGGVCVTMQVNALCSAVGLSSKRFLPQKLKHGMICLLLAALYQTLPGPDALKPIAIATIPIFLTFVRKKSVAFRRILVYNCPTRGGI